MSDPTISIVVATHERPWELLITLASLRIQTFNDFEVVVVHEPSTEHLIAQARGMTEGFDGRFRFVEYPNRMNDWGNTAKEWATKEHAKGQIVGHANGDNYYLPLYLSRLSGPILSGLADFTYCDFLSHNNHYENVLIAKPERCAVDGGGWLCRRDICIETPWDKSGCSPDGTYVDALVSGGARPVKVPGVFYVHN